MNDKHWVDTNILIYSVGDVVAKKTVAIQLLKTDAVISTQVVNEAVNVMHRKLKYDYAQIRGVISEILKRVELVTITDQTIFAALEMAEKYRYHYFDSLMIASALFQRCRTLYSEDLQHGQVIENRLRIINPFV
jgi:predicted nucleic acid-binding protein